MHLIYITRKSQSNLGRATSPPLTQTIGTLVTIALLYGQKYDKNGRLGGRRGKTGSRNMVATQKIKRALVTS